MKKVSTKQMIGGNMRKLLALGKTQKHAGCGFGAVRKLAGELAICSDLFWSSELCMFNFLVFCLHAHARRAVYFSCVSFFWCLGLQALFVHFLQLSCLRCEQNLCVGTMCIFTFFHLWCLDRQTCAGKKLCVYVFFPHLQFFGEIFILFFWNWAASFSNFWVTRLENHLCNFFTFSQWKPCAFMFLLKVLGCLQTRARRSAIFYFV